MTLADVKLAALLLIGCLVSIVPFPTTSAADGERWLSYEPAVVELRGRLTVEKRFGPPNWGEHPAIDAKLQVQMLVLDSPISVRGDPNDELNNSTITGSAKVQLIFFPGGPPYKRLVGKSVVACGTLSEAMTGITSRLFS